MISKDDLGFALRSAVMGSRSIHDKLGPDEALKRWEAEIAEREGSEAVYQWEWNCGRMGDLEGVFVATEEEVAAVVGKHASFGEVLGKHSDVNGTLEKDEFTKISSVPAVIALVKEHGPFGFNPLHYVTFPCDECGTQMNVQEEQDYWCFDCEQRLCYPCAEGTTHKECPPIVNYDKREEVS